ncbi:hypothetical protein [Streptomyces sp. MP131-18]|uniref:hypothetical protein n=1 Tax=Streptomyces sp. MP131-18 TaxID=1857892 RepID=UPI00097C4E3C|nr:hypothetical protein [Streptomyces sp. MP131-18]ONK13277.1 hypothetical protein STBA_40400 [Streptomyces sp. MP131-18]
MSNTSDIGQRYYPGAPAWWIRAAREALPQGHFPDRKDMQPGGIGISLLHAEVEGRVTVWMEIDTGRTVHDERPRRGTAAEERWLATRDDLAATLMDAGFHDIVRTRAGLLATAPQPSEPTHLHLRHANVFEEGVDALGRYTIRCPDHPHLRGLLVTDHGLGPTAFTYVYGHEDDQHPVWPQGFRGLHAAARAWAVHCGLPSPIEVTER